MNSSEYFKGGKNNIGWISYSFKDHFMDIEFTIPKKIELKTKKLERNMNDKEILAEFKPQGSSLGELAYALENNFCSKNGYANIFYIRDKSNVLWAVRARWDSDDRGWNVDADSVEDPDVWGAGDQVVSRDWNCENSDTNETLKLSNSEAVKITEIEYLGNRYKLIK